MPSINLKQRLTALSIAPSLPSSPHGPEPRSPISALKRKVNFTPPWARRPQNESNFMNCEPGMIQEVMARLIFQAGVDFETRPIVVINASALPDPREFSYDSLLLRIMSYLDLYVESDYTVVFFAAGTRHTPSWNWVWKAYRNLSRKYRKNLKQLYIVHSSLFSKMLFSLAGAVISPKFFRKIVYISSLSELASLIPLTQIDVPPAAYQENLKYEKTISLPVPTRSNIFGVPLEELMGYDGEKGGLPRVVKDSIIYLREKGLMEEGLFRRSPASAMLKAVQEAYDRGNVVSLNTFNDPHLAAVLLKKYLRDLPEPVFPEDLYPTIRRCPPTTNDPSDVGSITYIRETLLPTLPPYMYILLSQILHLLHEVSLRSGSNRMDAFNLAIVITPNLMKGSNPMRDVMMCSVPGNPAILASNMAPPTTQPNTTSPQNGSTLGMVIQICIQRYYEVFDEVLDRSEALPQSLSYHSSTFTYSERSSASASPQPQGDSTSEDTDDAVLVMPIGPTGTKPDASPPSAWTPTNGNGGTYKTYQRAANSGAPSRTKSVHTTFGDSKSSAYIRGSGTLYQSQGRAKSMVSIENTPGTTGTIAGRKGSISIGKGTTRKSSGAGVEAISITAEGFFAAPGDTVPPVSQKPSTVRGNPKGST